MNENINQPAIETYPAMFERFELELTLEDALYCSQPGVDAESMVNETMQLEYVSTQLDTISMQSMIDELYEYGAWELSELQNRHDNMQRLVWIAAGNIRDEYYPQE